MSVAPLLAGPRIGLRRHLRPELVPGDAVYLLSETTATALRGEHIEVLAPLLDGRHDLVALEDACRRRGVPGGVLTDMIDTLDRAGLLVEHGPSASGDDQDGVDDDAVLAYWDAAGVEARPVVRRVRDARVAVVDASAGALGGHLVAALGRAGLTAVRPGEAEPALTLVVCSDIGDPALAEADADARRTGVPWAAVKPGGEHGWLGPVLDGSSRPCWRCLAAQVEANRPVRRHVEACRGGGIELPAVALPGAVALVCDLAATQATAWIAGVAPTALALRVCHPLDLEVTAHPVRAIPQCPSCGDPGFVARRAAQPVVLGSRTKISGACGDRAATAEQTWDRFESLVDPVTGVVPAVRREARGPRALVSYRSGLNQAAHGAGADGLRSALRHQNGGKGLTEAQARVGALCEAVERYSGSFHGDEAVLHATAGELGPEALHPDACRLWHPRQIADRDAWNARHSAFQQVAPAFDEHETMPWTPMWSLTRGCRRLLPTAMAYYGGPGPAGMSADSNGCAAGASLEDAVLQGLLELVERDAVALWWYNRTPLPAVDLAGSGDPWLEEMLGVYADLGRELWALDLTADLGVPVVAALSRRTVGGHEDIGFGFGAHPDRLTATRRAVAELNQMTPAMIALADRSVPVENDPDLAHWLATGAVADQPHLLPLPASTPIPAQDPHFRARTDLRDDVTDLVDRLAGADLETLVLDQTRPDVGMPVVRVVVPGLRHFWARFGPGRLYDVPVALGRVGRPTRYEDLNPLPIFM